MSKHLALSTLKSTLAGAIAAFALVGVYTAFAQQQMRAASFAAPVVEGWIVNGKNDVAAWPAMKFQIKVENRQSKSRDLHLTAKLYRQEFKGNPLSRVSKPSDTVRELVEEKSLTGVVQPSKGREFTLAFKNQADLGKPEKGMPPRISYVVVIEADGKPIRTLFAEPPQNLG